MRAEDIINEPCGMGWEALEGDGCRRHCASCDREVVDLSASSRARAALVLASGACVRVRTDARGQARFRPSRLARLAAAVGLGLGLVSAEAQAEEARCDPVSGVALHSPEARTDLIGRPTRAFLLTRWLRSRRDRAWVSVRTGPGRFDELLVRCGAKRERADLSTGEAAIYALPSGKTCRARLTAGTEPTQTIVFTAGEHSAELCLGRRVPVADGEDAVVEEPAEPASCEP